MEFRGLAARARRQSLSAADSLERCKSRDLTSTAPSLEAAGVADPSEDDALAFDAVDADATAVTAVPLAGVATCFANDSEHAARFE